VETRGGIIMKYFNGCNTIEEVKTAYKRLAKQYHPDLGGGTETMQEINKEYAFACAYVGKSSGLSDDELSDEIKLSELYRQAIEKIIHLPGIVIELVGHWIWVTGDTYTVRNELKAAHFFFAPKKFAWYFRSDDFKTRGGKKSLDEIRRKYGIETIRNDNRYRSIEQE
jgi:hypothetical protein